MLMQYVSFLTASTLLAGTAIASHFEKRGTNVLFNRQLAPADCPVDFPGTVTCDGPGHCYNPTQRICCGEGLGSTCPVGFYCNPGGCCRNGEICTGGGGTLTESSVKTNFNSITRTSVSTIPVVVTSTSTSTLSYTTPAVLSSSSSTTPSSSDYGTGVSSTYVPPSPPTSSSSAPTTSPTFPIPVPAPSSKTMTPSSVAPMNTTSVGPAQFTGGAVPKTGEMVGGMIAAIVGVMGLVGIL